MKRCPTCEETKDLSEFAVHRNRSDGHQGECKMCRRARDKNSYKKNPEWYRERNRKAIARNQKYYFEYLASHPCVDCKESDVMVLEFDHIGEKNANVSNLMTGGLQQLKREIALCEVRCGNCHRRKTHERANTLRWQRYCSMV